MTVAAASEMKNLAQDRNTADNCLTPHKHCSGKRCIVPIFHKHFLDQSCRADMRTEIAGIEKELEDAMHDFDEEQYVNSQE